MTHQRTLESRRAAGEPVTTLPVVVAGRPAVDEWAAPPDLCTCADRRRAHDAWCPVLVWNAEVIPAVRAKLLDRVDKPLAEHWARLVGRARALREEIEWVHGPKGARIRRKTLNEQLVAKTVRGTTANPLLAHERETMKEARLLALDMGWSPIARTRLQGKKEQRRGLSGLTDGLPDRAPLRAVQ